MYVEEIVAKRKGKEYRSFLVRESFRVGSTVSHRTLANLSNLPKGCIEEIKRFLKGNSSPPDTSQIQILTSKEYGASYSILFIARKLKLDSLIFCKKLQWREDVLAMVAGRLLYNGNEVSLSKTFADTILWESCGHLPNIQPDINEHCYEPLTHLLSQQDSIQKKLRRKHQQKGSPTLLFIVSTIAEEEGEYRDVYSHSGDNEPSVQYVFNTTLLTNFEGCPLKVTIFPSPQGHQSECEPGNGGFPGRFNLQPPIVVGKQAMITKAMRKNFKFITPLTHSQASNLIKKEITWLDSFVADEFHEVIDPTDDSIRYVLYRNLEEKIERTSARNALIKKTEELLLKIQKKSQKLLREIEKVWDTLNTEHLFTWEIKEGRLFFSVNASQVLFDEQFDGCCILQTNIQREELPACEIFSAYQKLHPIQQSFKSIKTASTKFCAFPVEQRIQSHMLLSMLSYYLEWHITKKLESAFKLAQEKRAEKWTLAEAIERLKSIRSQTVQVAGMVLEQVKTTLDQEQEELISALEVRLQPT